jgi:integrase
MSFNPRAAKQLAPGKHLLVEGYPGLRLVATATRKTWTFRYEDEQGRMKQRKLGGWPAVDLSTAVAEWQSLRDQRDQGVDPVQQRREEREAEAEVTASTVADLIEVFITGYIEVERRDESAAWASNALRRVAREEPDFAQADPAEVTRRMAFDLIDRRKAFPTSAAKLKSLLGQCWDYGRDSGLIGAELVNHWREVLKGRLSSRGKIIDGIHQGKVHRVLSDDELKVLLPWCQENMHSNGWDGTVLYLWTGMRGGEIFGLRPEFIAQESDGWWVNYPVALLKTESHADTVDHRVPLVGRALEVIQRRLERVGETGFLFENMPRGVLQQYTQSAYGSYIYARQPGSAKAERRAGSHEGMIAPVGNWSPHDLRRTARTMLTRLRCDQRVAEAFIGHRPQGIVGTYDRHTFDPEKREWAPILADKMESLLQAGLPARP